MKLSGKQQLFLSFMLFSMFFGAGNLIFPAFLGRAAGADVWVGMLGFILSAVGLPILGVAAVAGIGGLDALGERISTSFSLIFMFIIYISIGPLMAIPRAATVAFEMGAKPFLPSFPEGTALLIYSILFFAAVLWLSLSPSKLVDRFGKLLTPLLLLLLGAVFVKSLITPLGGAAEASDAYTTGTFFKGFLDGYLTMDLLAALAFGIVVANTVRTQGITSPKYIAKYMITAGAGAGLLLAVIYSLLGYLGASSGAVFGDADNGTTVLTQVMDRLFGTGGTVLLGLLFTLACFCVSIGLIISCSEFFADKVPRLSYKQWAIFLTVSSALIANMGLQKILAFSVPVLGMIYPVALVLILLALCDHLIGSSRSVYVSTVVCTAAFSVLETINATIGNDVFTVILEKFPLYDAGVGWVIPAAAGFILGLLFKKKS